MGGGDFDPFWGWKCAKRGDTARERFGLVGPGGDTGRGARVESPDCREGATETIESVRDFMTDASSWADRWQVGMHCVVAWPRGKRMERWRRSQTINSVGHLVTARISSAAQKPRDADRVVGSTLESRHTKPVERGERFGTYR